MKKTSLLTLALAAVFVGIIPLSAVQAEPTTNATKNDFAFTLSAQDKSDLKRVEDYFNALPPLRGKFTQQTDDRPDVLTGDILLWRPGRLKITYTQPAGDFVVADGKMIYQWDSQLRQQSQASLEKTLAGVILRKNLSFSGDDVTVVHVDHPSEKELEIALRSATDPDAGTMTLVFGDQPLVFKGWRVLDAQNLITTVDLTEIKTDVKLSKSDFIFHNPDFGLGTRRR